MPAAVRWASRPAALTPPLRPTPPHAAHPPAESPPARSRVSPAARRTAALPSAKPPTTTLGSGAGFTAAVSGSGAQIKVAGRASSLTPATIVCGAFTRAALARASGSVLSQTRSPAASPANCTRRSSSRSAGSPGRRSIVPVAEHAPRPPRPPTRARSRAHRPTPRRKAMPLGNGSHDKPASCVTVPPAWGRAHFLAPVPSCARWNAAAADSSARYSLNWRNRPLSERSRRIRLRKSRSGTACAT